MKKIILAITIGLFTVSAFAQKQQNRHEFSVWGGGGISSLQYDAVIGGQTGNHKVGTGGIVGLGYDYFFNYNWSLGTGVEFSALAGKTEFSRVNDRFIRPMDQWGGGQQLISFETQGNDFYERQRAYYINIPVMARFQFDLFKGHKFYAAAGPKIGIPVDGIYRSQGTLRTTGYLWNNGISSEHRYENMPDQGFGTFDNKEKGDLDFKVNIMASVEAGIKWRFKENKKWHLYTGLFADFGLNDIVDGNGDIKDAKEFYEFNKETPKDYTVNSLFTSAKGDGTSSPTEYMASRVNTFAFGVKARVSFGIKPFDKKEKAPKVVEEKVYEGLTAAQMEDIMGRNTKALIDAQNKEFEELKELIGKEDPDFTGGITGFDLAKKDILPEMCPDLDRKVSLMKKYPKANVILEGHTDDYGSDKLNYQLGLDRANEVKAYMMARGIAASRMSVSSKGKTSPAIKNANEKSRRYNRRVEFILAQ